jgi:hypothetical protein
MEHLCQMFSKVYDNKSNKQCPTPFSQTYFHGTKAALKVGDLIETGFNSNFGHRKKQNMFF